MFALSPNIKALCGRDNNFYWGVVTLIAIAKQENMKKSKTMKGIKVIVDLKKDSTTNKS